MLRRTVALITVRSLILFSITCVKYKNEKVFRNEVPLHQETIVAVVTVDGMIVQFRENAAHFNAAAGEINGISLSGEMVTILLDDILYVRVKKVDPVLTLVATTAGDGVVATATDGEGNTSEFSTQF